MKHNFYVRAHHIPGVSNEIAEVISRFQDTRFRAAAPRAYRSPRFHPAVTYDPLRDEVYMYASWSLARSTNRTYSSVEKRFVQFCLMNHLINDMGDIRSASEGILIYFASHLAKTVKHSTIKLYLAAVCNLHTSCGHVDPV